MTNKEKQMLTEIIDLRLGYYRVEMNWNLSLYKDQCLFDATHLKKPSDIDCTHSKCQDCTNMWEDCMRKAIARKVRSKYGFSLEEDEDEISN